MGAPRAGFYHAFVCAGCLALAASARAATETFRFVAGAGEYAVGLRVVNLRDQSRTFSTAAHTAASQSRPLQALIWYPAKPTVHPNMTVADYAALLPREVAFDRPEISVSGKEAMDGLEAALQESLTAKRDAPAAKGKFPIVIYAPSISAVSWENADLCEYWASHGYIVLASPSLGPTTRQMPDTLAGIEAQALDISFLIGFGRSLPMANGSKVAVAGYSWGGISNVFAAARDPRIQALIALDGSVRYYPSLVASSGYVYPERFTIPLLYFTQGEFSLEQLQQLDPGLLSFPSPLNAWSVGDRLVVHMLGMTHVEFSSMLQRNTRSWNEFPKWQKADYDRSYGAPAYGWVARYCLAFLNAYLKEDSRSARFLRNSPRDNGVPAHFLATDFRLAKLFAEKRYRRRRLRRQT